MSFEDMIKNITGEALPSVQNSQANNAVAAQLGQIDLTKLTQEQLVTIIRNMSANQTVAPSAAPAGIQLQLNESAQRPELKEFIVDDPVKGKVMSVLHYTGKDYEGYKLYFEPFSIYGKQPFGGGLTPNDCLYIEAAVSSPEWPQILATIKKFNRNPAIAATSRFGKKQLKAAAGVKPF